SLKQYVASYKSVRKKHRFFWKPCPGLPLLARTSGRLLWSIRPPTRSSSITFVTKRLRLAMAFRRIWLSGLSPGSPRPRSASPVRSASIGRQASVLIRERSDGSQEKNPSPSLPMLAAWCCPFKLATTRGICWQDKTLLPQHLYTPDRRTSSTSTSSCPRPSLTQKANAPSGLTVG